MMKTILVSLLFSCTIVCQGEIVVNQNGDDGFDVLFNGLLLLQHSQAKPSITLGKGTFDAVYNQGNYNVTDTITEAIPLNEFSIVNGVSEVYLHLSAGPDLGITVHLTEPEANVMEVDFDYFAYTNADINRFFMDIVTTDDEYVWGAGEQYTYLNLRGRDYPIWVREQGFGRNKSSLLTQIIDELYGAGGDYHTTYWPQPSFLSSRKYYFELMLPTYSELRFAPADQSAQGHTVYWHRTPVPGQSCELCKMRFQTGPTLMSVVQAINPGAPALPEWVYNGAILGVQGGTDQMLGYLQQADDAGAKISAMWIQDWSGKIVTDFGTRVFWNWRWNETWYPNLDQVIQDLKDRNVRVTAYLNAHLNVEGDVYQGMESDSVWITDKDGGTLLQDFGEFTVATFDLTQPDPSCQCTNPNRQVLKNLITTNLLDLGFSGWMADFGEYTPTNARTAYAPEWWGEVDQEEILHQTVAEEWASINREAVEEAGKLDDILFWMRAGGRKSKFYQTMSWAGDQTVDWTQSDGLKSSIVAALSLACGGMGLSHSDIGGYTGTQLIALVRSKELLLRWAEYSAFTPVMRTHEGNQPNANHQVYTDEDTFRQFARLTNIYVDLAQYIREAVDQNRVDKIPVMRPLFLQFENDTGSYDQEYEYMFGDDLLVAPVTEKGATEWEVYLPGPQGWVHLWDDLQTPLQGPTTFTVNAMLGEPPVFYKYDSQWRDLFYSINTKYSLSQE